MDRHASVGRAKRIGVYILNRSSKGVALEKESMVDSTSNQK